MFPVTPSSQAGQRLPEHVRYGSTAICVNAGCATGRPVEYSLVVLVCHGYRLHRPTR